MRKLILTLSLMLPLAALAAVGIRNSAHDLSTTSTATVRSTSNNQICIYCHTPHHAMSTTLLWNHTATASTTFTWGTDENGQAVTRTTAGTLLPTTLAAGSKRCLGCHDGSVALGDVANSGSGMAGVIAGLESIAGHTDASGKLISGAVLGAGGNMGGSHPVSIPYAGQTGYNGIDSAVPADQVGPAVTGGYYNVVTAGCTSPTGVCTSADTADGRNGAAINLIPWTAGSTTNVGVECGSCHEPHNAYGFPSLTRVDVSNASGLCRSCHNK